MMSSSGCTTAHCHPHSVDDCKGRVNASCWATHRVPLLKNGGMFEKSSCEHHHDKAADTLAHAGHHSTHQTHDEATHLHLTRARTCISQWMNQHQSKPAHGENSRMIVPTASTQRRNDHSFLLASQLTDPTLMNKTIVIAMVFHILSPIYHIGTNTAVPANDSKTVKEYCEFLVGKINAGMNCSSPEFDDADFEKDRLFSPRMNVDRTNAINNRRIYCQYMSFARKMNIKFEVQHDQCTYKPDWDDFNSPTLDYVYKAHLRNSLDPNYRDFIEPLCKSTQQSPETGEFNLDTGFGDMAIDPAHACHLWILEFPDHQPGQQGSMCGFSTFPSDPRAGTGCDGIVLNADVLKWDATLMDPALNRYCTLIHEAGHWLSLSHTFDVEGQVNDMPSKFQNRKHQTSSKQQNLFF